MNVPTELIQVLVLVATAIPVIATIRLIAGGADAGLNGILTFDASLPWPKGVQEEEPQPWRFDSAPA